jgi:ATP-dependent DNA helicase DinG
VTTRYVAIDTETTGVNFDQDEIIEVGAVAFDQDGVLDEFHALVRPYRPLPYEIERLTGIAPADLEAAPHFAAIAAELAGFIGDSPVVGQNVAFDLEFLARAGVQVTGGAFDTWELGQLLMPAIGEYSLRNLAAQLGIEFPQRHRALADAEAARAVFLALRRRLGELPPWLLEEVERFAAAGDWSVAALIREVLAEGGARGVSALHGGQAVAGTADDFIARPEEIAKPLGAVAGGIPVSAAEVLT